MELFKAHKQWSIRPDDERFWTVQEAHAASDAYRSVAVEKPGHYGDLRVEAQGEDVHLVGRSGIPAKLTHWAFGQLSSLAGAPAGYLRGLPATLAAQNLNYGMKARESNGDEPANLLFHRNGDILLRSITSSRYSRIWNADVLERLADLGGWVASASCPSS
jgi:hypothetical protein